jgi:hypothetical protein
MPVLNSKVLLLETSTWLALSPSPYNPVPYKAGLQKILPPIEPLFLFPLKSRTVEPPPSFISQQPTRP